MHNSIVVRRKSLDDVYKRACGYYKHTHIQFRTRKRNFLNSTDQSKWENR